MSDPLGEQQRYEDLENALEEWAVALHEAHVRARKDDRVEYGHSRSFLLCDTDRCRRARAILMAPR